MPEINGSVQDDLHRDHLSDLEAARTGVGALSLRSLTPL